MQLFFKWIAKGAHTSSPSCLNSNDHPPNPGLIQIDEQCKCRKKRKKFGHYKTARSKWSQNPNAQSPEIVPEMQVVNCFQILWCGSRAVNTHAGRPSQQQLRRSVSKTVCSFFGDCLQHFNVGGLAFFCPCLCAEEDRKSDDVVLSLTLLRLCKFGQDRETGKREREMMKGGEVGHECWWWQSIIQQTNKRTSNSELSTQPTKIIFNFRPKKKKKFLKCDCHTQTQLLRPDTGKSWKHK